MKKFLRLFRENSSRHQCFDCFVDFSRVLPRVAEHCFLNHTLVTSEFILGEVKEKLVEKFKYSTETAEEAVALFRSKMQIVTPAALASPVSRDPDDDNILAAAVAGNCDCIITGDKDLLVLKQFEGIKILSPREFSDQERTE